MRLNQSQWETLKALVFLLDSPAVTPVPVVDSGSSWCKPPSPVRWVEQILEELRTLRIKVGYGFR